MKINFDSVASVAMKTESLGDTLKQSVLETRSPLNASFSPVSGIDHVGSIHQGFWKQILVQQVIR